ncbi:MAG: response regulator transcription factor [Bacteroidia bacterium]|nr:response regulator transcription factor [Bacteroidia bacterium]
MNRIKILVVEDDVFIAQDISEHLTSLDYWVTGVAYRAEEAYEELKKELPDLVLLDINLGKGEDGICIARHIQKEYQIPFIFLSSYSSSSVLERAKPTHPLGYIVKPFNEQDLYTSIEIGLYNYAQRWQPSNWNPETINRKLVTEFTPKEVEVLQDIFEGKTNRQLSQKHHISLNTVKTHVKRIYEKLEVHARSEAMAKLRNKLAR